jgi:hypothetical protein
MKIEGIKKEVEDWAKETSPTVNSESQRCIAAYHAINTYYFPLAESHRELVEVLEGIKDALSTIGVSVPPTMQSTLSNAKKIINENNEQIPTIAKMSEVVAKYMGWIRLKGVGDSREVCTTFITYK